MSLADLKVAYFQKYVKINLVTNVINNFEIFWGEIFMKMNKLFTSLATSVMVLSTVAPVAVANAADEGGTGGGTAPAAADKPANVATTNNEKTGTGKLESSATVKVVDGYLVLNKVPSFGFGDAVPEGVKSAENFKPAIGNDENSVLSITESRHSAAASGGAVTKGLGYTVKVTMGAFKDADSNSATTYGDDNWSLDLPRVSGSVTVGGQTTPLQTAEVTGVKSNGSSTGTVVKMGAGIGYGTDDFDFSHNTAGIKLHIPSETQLKGSDTAYTANRNYSSILTWTLDAAAPTA